MTQQANDPALERLMQAAQTGDARAYECLLSDITPRLRRLIQSQRRFLKPDEIEDILQDVDAVEMLKLREMSLKEAAAESGMSVGSLKVAVHRGIAALRKALVKDQ